MATVRELTAKLGFDVDDSGLRKFDANLGQAKKDLKSTGEEAKKTGINLERMGAAAKRGGEIAIKAIAGVTAAVGAAATAGLALTRSFAETADQFAKDARRFGTSAEALQELSLAAQFSGSDITKLQDGLRSLSTGLQDLRTKGTGPTAEALQALGIEADDARIQGDDLIQITTNLADSFAGLEDGAQKAAIAQKLFGGAGLELIPLLDAGAEGIGAMRDEARDLGAVISNETAAAAEEFNDDALRLQTTLEGVRNEVAAELLPIFREIVVEVSAWVRENRTLIASRVREFIGGVTSAAKALAPIVTALVENWQILAGIFAGAKLSSGLSAAASGFAGLGSAAAASLGPIGQVAGALVALIPLAIKAGNALGDALAPDVTTRVERGEGSQFAESPEIAQARQAVFDAERAVEERGGLVGSPLVAIQLGQARERLATLEAGAKRAAEAQDNLRKRRAAAEAEIKRQEQAAQVQADASRAAAEARASLARPSGGGGGGGAAEAAPSIDDLIAGALGQPGVGATGIRGVGPGTTVNRIDASIRAPTTITIEVPAGVLAGRSLEEQSRAIGEIAGREIDKRNREAFDAQKSQIVG